MKHVEGWEHSHQADCYAAADPLPALCVRAHQHELDNIANFIHMILVSIICLVDTVHAGTC